MHVEMIWSMADIAITLMLVINLIGVAKLSHRVVDSTREFVLASKAE